MTRTVGIVIFPRFQLLDAAGPISAFEIAARFAGGAYDLHIMAAEPGAVASSSGVRMHAEAFDSHMDFDTLLIAGGDGVRDAAGNEATMAFVRHAAARARRVSSVCSGAFVLATAGLLDGKRATTHWNRSASFARAFPAIRLEPDKIYVRDGETWTSAGITAGIDMALAMIGDDLGEAIARQTAQQLVVHHRRPGGQSQFSALLELQGGRFEALLAWARENLAEPLTVEQLAEQAAMSPRNFARAFTAQSGVTPAKAVEQLRVEAARALLDSAPLCVEDVALEVGFGDPERMRRAFLRAFGLPPQALRRAAKAA
ncbi:MAG: transcriptional regulator, AraC family [Caulobacter sp.]|nr:transcriptional regulator, AraC family [Caulobacter sp.]